MSKRLWLPTLAGLIALVTVPAVAQEGIRLTDAIHTALASHPSILQAEKAVQSAVLSFRLSEIDHGAVTVTLHATPASGSVNLTPWEEGSFSDVVTTLDADSNVTISATTELPWGMIISGSYTAGFELDDLDEVGFANEESFTDAQSISISQNLLHPGRLSPTAIALESRRENLRLSRLRLRREQNDVVQQVAVTFLDIVERKAALAVLTERLRFAKRDLSATQSRVEQRAESELDLLNARIAVIQWQNAVTDAQSNLDLDTVQFFANLDLPKVPLVATPVDLTALRHAAQSLLATSVTATALDTSLPVLEAEVALATAKVQAERTALGSLPKLSLSLDYSKGGGEAFSLGNLSVSLTGSYTLFDGGRQALSLEQAKAQVSSARRLLTDARINTQSELERTRHALRRAMDAEELSALQVQSARLHTEQATRQHAAGLTSETALKDAALSLQEAKDSAHASSNALRSAYMALSLKLDVDLREILLVIAG